MAQVLTSTAPADVALCCLSADADARSQQQQQASVTHEASHFLLWDLWTAAAASFICSHWLELVKHCVTMETPSSTALYLSQLPARRCCRCLSSCSYLAVGAVIMRMSSRRRGLTLGSTSVHHLLTTAATVANELAGHGAASVRVTCPSLSAMCSTTPRRVASGWRATRVILQLKLVSVQDGESV